MRRPPKPKRPITKVNRLGTKADGLQWRWRWPTWNFNDCQNCWYGGPGDQTACARQETEIGTVKLTTIKWPAGEGKTDYEGELSVGDHVIISVEHLPTRVKSQLAAEKLISKVIKVLTKLARSL